MSSDYFSVSPIMDRQTFGAAVVTKTLDYMNNSPGNSFAPVDRQTFGAAVVSKTLDYMNSGGGGGQGDMAQTYDFSSKVLGAVYNGFA